MNLQMLGRVLAFYGRFLFSFTEPGFRFRRFFWRTATRDFRGQVWLVSGASGGLGAYIAGEAVKAGATVIAAARDAGKLAALRESLAPELRPRLEPWVCDFALQSKVTTLLQQLHSGGRRIDVLVNNVGVLCDAHELTAEGRERSFAINLLSHFQLTEGLLANGLLGEGAAVINMSSGGGYNFPLLPELLNVTEASRYNGTAAYACHKRAQMVLNAHWRGVYGNQNIAFYVMHPGWVDTEGVQRSLPRFRRALKSILRDAASGADTALWLAAERPTQADVAGVWFDRALRPAHVFAYTREGDRAVQSLIDRLRGELNDGQSKTPAAPTSQ
ncbi:MAG: SDR family NAD(P)-dependent oxidoreductase [Sinobacteraceae bacterium]|nr:SDR family NAD(P)-dependent oxidoreductase [Nevskiaceae bacterium]